METMAEAQWKRWDVLQRLGKGKLTTGQAAQVLRLSVRHVRRLRRRVEQDGRRAPVHGNRGRPPAHTLEAATRARILALRRTTYRDFNDTHFTEKLALESPPIRVAVRTVRRLLRAAGIGSLWRRRPRQHH